MYISLYSGDVFRALGIEPCTVKNFHVQMFECFFIKVAKKNRNVFVKQQKEK